MKPKYEVADIIREFGESFTNQYHPNPYLQKTLRALENCRTSIMGWHLDECDSCGHLRISYNSCRNRHCPKCQNTQREAWIENRKQDLLPVPYFHVVFTVTDKLNSLFMHKPVLMYNLLFQSAWETIAQFSHTNLRVETGMIAILHTWGQSLSLHPHLHCIVPGGGVDYKSQWKQVNVSNNGKVFLFDVENLSVVFREKFIDALQKQLPQQKQFINELYENRWGVNSREPFGGPEQVVEYLGRYTHKVAISNHRLLSIDESGVKFRWRDYRDNIEKIMPLSRQEFLRRFCMHILPKRFVRIRHFGILSSTRRKELRDIQRLLGLNPPEKRIKKDWKQICKENLNYNPDVCPCCGEGKMITIKIIPPNFRGPPKTPVLANVLEKI
ncbi:MAG: IS91 family transposase [Smithella sp.]